MFRVQTNMFGRYHITDPSAFYEKTTAWSVAADPGSSVSGVTAVAQPVPQFGAGPPPPTTSRRIDPFYMLMRLPDEAQESFLMMRPYVPFADSTTNERQTLTSFMVAKSDQDDYGKIIVYEMPTGQEINGPVLANSQILADQEIARQLTLLNQQGSKATLGNMLLVPLESSIMYVRPLYVSSDSNQVPQLKQVIVASGGQVAMRPTLRGAIQAVFPNARPETLESSTILQPDLPDSGGSGSSTTTTTTPSSSTTTTVAPPTGDETVDQLLTLASQAYDDAQAALTRSDLGTYQAKVKEAQGYVTQALAKSSATTTSAPPSNAPASTTPTTVPGTPA